jgi:serine-type D-Ala-D-Ala carboxypeptidase/endopeptidase
VIQCRSISRATAAPYEGYAADALFAFLGKYRLERAPGAKWEYSNVGMGLVGHVLALKAGIAYEDLLRRRLLDPLGMSDTRITLDDAQVARRATGHNTGLRPVLPWTGGVIAPTGGISSTATDMLKFAADVFNDASPRQRAYERMLSVKRPGSAGNVQQTLGWEMYRRGGSDMVGHNGGTFGFEARLLLDLRRKRAVIAWASGRSGNGVIDLVGAAIDQATLQPN